VSLSARSGKILFSKSYLQPNYQFRAMSLAVLGVVLAADTGLLLVVAISVFFPNRRIWPPPKKDTWQQYLSWSLFTFVMFGVPLLGILDFESIGALHWSRYILGAFLFAFGLGIDLWGTRTLTAQQSMGESAKIITQGPYRFTRNPQYVGFIILYGGLIIAFSSYLALVTGLFAIFLFLVLPYSEEPWLRQQYGQAFEDYCRMVPRFIGVRTFKPIIDN
jgi:protein-S-isoprenylcysteine O-methyltransferase Ste14